MLDFGSIGEFALAEFADAANSNLHATDTAVLQLPINCVLAGQQLIKDRYRENDLFNPNLKTDVIVTRSRAGLLGTKRPSFTIRTDKKGYD